MDIYQERYLKHQEEKKKQLSPVVKNKPKKLINDEELQTFKKIIRSRTSSRVFTKQEIDEKTFDSLIEDLKYIPSSCNRQSVYIKSIESRDEKELLSGLLVGGVGWIHRAEKILLLFANQEAYKEGLFYMPYLDAGVLIQQIYLSVTAHNLSCCFVNPNIREINKEHFENIFGDGIFCGAIALGKSKYTNKSPKKKSIFEF